MLIISTDSKHDRISHYNEAWQSVWKQQCGKLITQVLDGGIVENIQSHVATFHM